MNKLDIGTVARYLTTLCFVKPYREMFALKQYPNPWAFYFLDAFLRETQETAHPNYIPNLKAPFVKNCVKLFLSWTDMWLIV